MEDLWGKLEPIPADRLRETRDGDRIRVGSTTVHVLATPGHAAHHNVYLVDGMAFTGDMGGVAIAGGPVLPPTPPPDIDLGRWRTSLARLRAARPDAICPTHFGRFDDVTRYLDELASELEAWADWFRPLLSAGKDEEAIVPEFEKWLEGRLRAKGIGEEGLAAYRFVLPFAMNVTGLVRCWKKTGFA